MRNFKKIIQLGLTAVTALSIMSMNVDALAKEVVLLDDGIKMTVYEPGELPENTFSTLASNAPFSKVIAKYPLHTILSSLDGKTDIFLQAEDTIVLNFDRNNEYTFGYQGLYDVTDDEYKTDHNGNILVGPFHVGSTLLFENLEDAHSYRILLSSTAENVVARGTMSTQ